MKREAFEKIQRVKDHLEQFDIYYTSLGGYLYTKDTTPCFYLNGAWMMYCYEQDRISKVLDYVRSNVKDENIVDVVEEILQ